MGAWQLLLEIVILLGAALLFGAAARRLNQKAVVGYLVAGLLLGPNSLGLVRSVETVQFLAELGVALLLFTIGLEFSWRRIAALGRQAVVAGVLQIGLTAAAGGAAALALGISGPASFVAGAALALSSTAVVLRVLADRTELESPHGRSALGILLLQDAAIVPLLILVSVIAEGKRGTEGLAELALSLSKAVVLVGAFYVAIRLILPLAYRAVDWKSERDFPVLLAVLVSVGCAWSTHSAGFSPAMGAFVAGLLLADRPAADQIRADVIPLRSVFVTLFFSSIGMLATTPHGGALLVVPLLGAAIVAGKMILAALPIRLLGHSAGVAAGTGLALAQIGEFSFVLAKEAFNKRLLPEDVFQPLVASSVVTLLASPYLIGLAPRVASWVDRRTGRGAGGPRAMEPAAERPRVILIGYGPAGQRVGEALLDREIPFTVLDLNPLTAAGAGDRVRIRLGDATQEEILIHAGVPTADAVVVTTPDPAVTRTILRQVRALAPGVPVIARARYHIYAQPLRDQGASVVVDEEEGVGQLLADQAVNAVVEPAERRTG